ncbi:MAG: hypothetical protein OXN83_03040 [Oligoflexia bacterium]|nr:hypothetical protein [Oligoflexia bacterium]
MKHGNAKKEPLSDLFEKQEEKMLVNQILSGNIFMTAEEYHPIKIKDIGILSSKDKLQNLIWNKNVIVKKLYIDETNCIVAEVYLNDQSLKKLLEE